MDGKREDQLTVKESPTLQYKLRGLDDLGKSVLIPYAAFVETPNEDDIKDFIIDNKIVKKRYVGGSWIELGIEWDI